MESEDDNTTGGSIHCFDIHSDKELADFLKEDNVNNSLKMFHINLRSVRKNFNDIVVYLEAVSVMFDIIVFTECWLSGGGWRESIEGYDLVTTETFRNQNDGVVIYIHNRLSAVTTQIAFGDVYGLNTNFTYGKNKFNLLTFYRTHDSDINWFLEELERYYNNICKGVMCIFMGDLNIDILDNDVYSDRYMNSLLQAGLVQCIDRATRVTDNDRGSCLDHIFTSYCDLQNVRSAVVHTEITDHYSTVLTITDTDHSHSVTQPTTQLTYIDLNVLTDQLSHSNWDPVLSCLEVNASTDNFLSIIKGAMERSTKLINKSNSRFKKLKPWITTDLIACIRYRDKLSKSVKHQPFNINLKERFYAYRQFLSNSLKQAKRDYYRTKITNSGKNTNIFWGVVNELAGRVKHKDKFPIQKYMSSSIPVNEDGCRQAAHDFNTYFSAVGQNLANAINGGGDPVVRDSDYSLNSNFTLNTVTEQDIVRYVSSLRGGSAPGHDGFSAKALKENIHILTTPLQHIINLSILSGIFPDNFKMAKVVPLHKSNTVTDKSNFRPISLLSVFSKILERIVKDQLTDYLDNNNILCNCQFGFRKDKNINDALYEVVKQINLSFTKNNRSMLIFLDLTKAFDSVDRGKLLQKLDLIGVRGNALAWFRSYLTERRQSVSICGVNSDALPIDFGVVQGSTLGPILFLIYINNISRLKLFSKLSLFADDTLIFIESSNWQDARIKALHDLMFIKQWLDQNTLSLNISKTKFMPISLRECSDYTLRDLTIHSCGDYLNLTCNCEAIERVTTYKYLGVIIDHRVRWAEHIQYIKTKIRKYLFAFRQLREVLNDNEIKIVYYAYIQSLLSFGIVAWGGANKSILEPLYVVQKSILKVAFNKARRYPTDTLFQDVSVLNIRQLFIKHLMVFIFKHYNSIFSPILHTYSTRYSANVGFLTPTINKSFSTTTPVYIAHALLLNLQRNKPNFNLFSCTSISIFKKQVTDWINQIGLEGAENVITSVYGRN